DKLLSTKFKDKMEDKDMDAMAAVATMARSCKSFECRSIIAGLGGAQDCKNLIKKELAEGSASILSMSKFEKMLTDNYGDCREKIRNVIGVKDLDISDYFFEEKPRDEGSTEPGPGKQTVDACASPACETVGDEGKLKNPKACKEKLVAIRGGEREFKIRLSV